MIERADVYLNCWNIFSRSNKSTDSNNKSWRRQRKKSLAAVQWEENMLIIVSECLCLDRWSAVITIEGAISTSIPKSQAIFLATWFRNRVELFKKCKKQQLKEGNLLQVSREMAQVGSGNEGQTGSGKLKFVTSCFSQYFSCRNQIEKLNFMLKLSGNHWMFHIISNKFFLQNHLQPEITYQELINLKLSNIIQMILSTILCR